MPQSTIKQNYDKNIVSQVSEIIKENDDWEKRRLPMQALLENTNAETLEYIFHHAIKAFNLPFITIIFSLKTENKPTHQIPNELSDIYSRLRKEKMKSAKEKKSFDCNTYWKKLFPVLNFFIKNLKLPEQDKRNIHNEIFKLAALLNQWPIVRIYISRTDPYKLAPVYINGLLKLICSMNSWDDKVFSTLNDIIKHHSDSIELRRLNRILDLICSIEPWNHNITNLFSSILPLKPEQTYIDRVLNKLFEQKKWSLLQGIALNQENLPSSVALSNLLKNLAALKKLETPQWPLIEEIVRSTPPNLFDKDSIKCVFERACQENVSSVVALLLAFTGENALTQEETNAAFKLASENNQTQLILNFIQPTIKILPSEIYEAIQRACDKKNVDVIKALIFLKGENEPTIETIKEVIHSLIITYKATPNGWYQKQLIWSLLTELYVNKHLELDKDTINSILNIAAANGEEAFVKQLCNQQENDPLTPQTMNEALIHAAQGKQWALVRYFINLENVTLSPEALDTALIAACHNNEWSLVEELIKHPCSAKAIGEVLSTASKQEKWEIITPILQTINDDQINDETLDQLLVIAYEKSQLKIVQDLIKREGNHKPTQLAIHDILNRALKAFTNERYIKRYQEDLIITLCTMKKENQPSQEMINKALKKAFNRLSWKIVKQIVSIDGTNQPSADIVGQTLIEIADRDYQTKLITTLCALETNLPSSNDFSLAFQNACKTQNPNWKNAEIIFEKRKNLLSQESITFGITQAAIAGQEKLVTTFLQLENTDLPTSPDLQTALTQAALHRRWPVVESLIKYNNDAATTAIILNEATKTGNTALVQRICEQNESKPNSITISDALKIAGENYKWDILLYLLNSKGESKPTFESVSIALKQLINVPSYVHIPLIKISETLENLIKNDHLDKSNYCDILNFAAKFDLLALAKVMLDRIPSEQLTEQFLKEAANGYTNTSNYLAQILRNNVQSQPLIETMTSNSNPSLDDALQTGEETPSVLTENEPVIDLIKQSMDDTIPSSSAEQTKEKTPPTPDKDQTVKSKATQETPSNQLLQGFVTATIINISGTKDKNGISDTTRYTHNHTHKKVVLLEKLKTWLNNPIKPGEEEYVLAIIKSICEIKRHRYHLFSKPHSLRELDVFIKNNPQVQQWVNERIDISKEQIDGLKDSDAISSLLEILSKSSNSTKFTSAT